MTLHESFTDSFFDAETGYQLHDNSHIQQFATTEHTGRQPRFPYQWMSVRRHVTVQWEAYTSKFMVLLVADVCMVGDLGHLLCIHVACR